MKRSAGLLMYRIRGGAAEVLLVHPGGPFWAKKDLGAWSIPKGEYGPGEDPLDAARREFEEETGIRPGGPLLPLAAAGRQPGGKEVLAWAVEGDADPAAIRSSTFWLEWPPRSGKQLEFPEVDRAGWFAIDVARRKIVRGQVALLEQLERLLERAAASCP
jgi:predicted NUDIX family NTP pyrophosphohydrolase